MSIQQERSPCSRFVSLPNHCIVVKLVLLNYRSHPTSFTHSISMILISHSLQTSYSVDIPCTISALLMSGVSSWPAGDAPKASQLFTCVSRRRKEGAAWLLPSVPDHEIMRRDLAGRKHRSSGAREGSDTHSKEGVYDSKTSRND